ncbi:MAG TPA: PhzF family phenazine biosynthesis protein [Terriglobales bacterium]|nr:PhzF family phenazine biosynthesis protein [Terriglobales bacterium]
MSQPTRRFSVVQMDVFSAKPLEGNPLAVFPDARGLSDAEMQAVAREMNLSETTYIFPREASVQRERGVRVRIFTVGEELPFAGHPTLGTAFVLRGSSGAQEVALDLKVGKIPVRFEDGRGQPVFGEMRQRDPELGEVHERAAVAAAAGLRPEEIVDDVPIQTVSTGVAFVIVPLRSLATMQGMRVDLQHAAEYLERGPGKFFYFVSREAVDPSARLHARMFFYNGEDPATGSAAGCAAAWMTAHGVAKPGERALIEQGVEMGRPSRIFVRADKDGNRVVNVRVGGNAVEVLRGEVVL